MLLLVASSVPNPQPWHDSCFHVGYCAGKADACGSTRPCLEGHALPWSSYLTSRLSYLTSPPLRTQGLPVFYAPGEAEAVCAALSRAGCVDGCGSNDSDCLVYGAESVYHTLKLSVSWLFVI